MEMGLVNQVWDDVETWIDDEVERIPIDEKTAHKSVLDAKERLDTALKEKEDAKNTICIEIKQKNAEVLLTMKGKSYMQGSPYFLLLSRRSK